MAADEYERLIRPIEDRMMRTVWRIVGDPDEAEDALQNALAKIWSRLEHVRRHANPTALVLRICANAAYDILRRRRRSSHRLGPADDPPAQADSVPQRLLLEERRAAVRQAVAQLPRKQALAVLLRDVEDQSYEDVAQALGCRQSTARKHVARGRKRLRGLLAQMLDETPNGDE